MLVLISGLFYSVIPRPSIFLFGFTWLFPGNINICYTTELYRSVHMVILVCFRETWILWFVFTRLFPGDINIWFVLGCFPWNISFLIRVYLVVSGWYQYFICFTLLFPWNISFLIQVYSVVSGWHQYLVFRETSVFLFGFTRLGNINICFTRLFPWNINFLVRVYSVVSGYC